MYRSARGGEQFIHEAIDSKEISNIVNKYCRVDPTGESPHECEELTREKRNIHISLANVRKYSSVYFVPS